MRDKYEQLYFSGILLWIVGMGFGIIIMSENLIKYSVFGFMGTLVVFILFVRVMNQVEKEDREFFKNEKSFKKVKK